MSEYINQLKREAESENLQEVFREVLGPIKKAMKLGNQEVCVEVNGSSEFEYRMLLIELERKEFKVTECGKGTFSDSKILRIQW